jgi:hypothetical protein
MKFYRIVENAKAWNRLFLRYLGGEFDGPRWWLVFTYLLGLFTTLFLKVIF